MSGREFPDKASWKDGTEQSKSSSRLREGIDSGVAYTSTNVFLRGKEVAYIFLVQVADFVVIKRIVDNSKIYGGYFIIMLRDSWRVNVGEILDW